MRYFKQQEEAKKNGEIFFLSVKIFNYFIFIIYLFV